MPVRAIPGRLLILVFTLFVVVQWWSGPAGAFFGSRDDAYDALDFAVFYAAGDLVAGGDGHRLYHEGALTAVQHAAIPLPPEATPAYLNPPFFAALIAPLAYLPFDRAFQAWTILNLALFGVSSVLLWKIARPLALPGRIALVGGFAVLPQAAVALQLGQFSLILLVSWLSTYVLLRDGRDRAAGVALAPLLIKPELLVPVAAFLLWKRRMAVFSTLLPITAVAIIASLAIVGLDGVIEYPAHVRDAASSFTPGTNSTHKMFGWTGILGAAMGPERPALQTLLAIPLAALTLGAVALLWRGPFDTAADRFPVQWLALTLGTLLADPHLYHQDTVLLYPAVAAALVATPDARRWLVPMIAAAWLIGSMGQSPNVNANIGLFGIFMVVALAVTVAGGRARPPERVLAEAAPEARAA